MHDIDRGIERQPGVAADLRDIVTMAVRTQTVPLNWAIGSLVRGSRVRRQQNLSRRRAVARLAGNGAGSRVRDRRKQQEQRCQGAQSRGQSKHHRAGPLPERYPVFNPNLARLEYGAKLIRIPAVGARRSLASIDPRQTAAAETALYNLPRPPETPRFLAGRSGGRVIEFAAPTKESGRRMLRTGWPPPSTASPSNPAERLAELPPCTGAKRAAC